MKNPQISQQFHIHSIYDKVLCSLFEKGQQELPTIYHEKFKLIFNHIKRALKF